MVTAARMEALGATFAAVWGPTGLIYLQGELGTGKTTFVRGFLRGKGYTGVVKSPTFTLVESYPFTGHSLCHFDLFRLTDPRELEFLGVRDYLAPESLCLVEWPERGAGVLPPADLTLTFSYLPQGRGVTAVAGTPRGQSVLGAVPARSARRTPQH